MKRKLRPELKQMYIQAIKHVDAALELTKNEFMRFQNGRDDLVSARMEMLQLLEDDEVKK